MTILLILIALCAESLAIYLPYIETKTHWFWFWGIHGFASLAFSWAAARLVYKRVSRYSIPFLVFVAVISFTMPVVGMLGLVLLYTVLTLWKTEDENLAWRRASIANLPTETTFVEEDNFGVAGIKDILINHPSGRRRLEAIKACRYLPQKKALPLFRIAILDPEDDIRLLAFSYIDQIENELNKKIDTLKETISNTSSVNAYMQIGELYWELYYLGLGEGYVLKHYLRLALDYYNRAANIEPLPQYFYKIGRIYLALGDQKYAKYALEGALELGMEKENVAMYLAEVAFNEGRYGDVAKLLCSTDADEQDTEINQLVGYWCE